MAKVKELVEKSVTAEEKMLQLQKDLDAAKGEVGKAEQAKKDAEAKIKTLEQENAGVKVQVKTLQQENAGIKDQVKTLQQENADVKAKAEEKASQLQKDLDAAKSEVEKSCTGEEGCRSQDQDVGTGKI